MIAVEDWKLAYVALPKAGCSSVKQMLATIDPRVCLPENGSVDDWHRIYPTRRHDPATWTRYTGHFRFCVVRDPAKRLMSCYGDIVVKRGALSHSPRVRRAAGLPMNPDPDTFFRRLARYRRKSSLVRHHVLGAGVFLGPDLAGDYDRVYRTSELGELADDLSRRSGQKVALPHANQGRGRLRLRDLSGGTIDRLRPLLDEEYAYLAGYYANPLGPRIHDACAIPTRSVS